MDCVSLLNVHRKKEVFLPSQAKKQTQFNMKRRHTTQHKMYLNHININMGIQPAVCVHSSVLYFSLLDLFFVLFCSNNGKCSIQCTQRCQYLFKKFTMLPERYNDMLNNLLFNVIMVN